MAEVAVRSPRLTLGEGIFECRGLVKDGRLDAYVGWFVHDGRMTGTVVSGAS